MNTKGMKKIGTGAFSTVYKKGNNKVLIKSVDPVKECMSLGWFPNSSLFPKIERVAKSDCGEYSFYEEKYYPKVSSLKNNLLPNEYEFYKTLRNLHPTMGYNRLFEAFDKLPSKFARKKAHLKEAIDGLSSYGEDICFEISPRNVAVHNKKLVLLDCFFMETALSI